MSKIGKTFDEFNVGEKITFPLATITEHHILSWAALSGDFNPLHLNAEFAKKTPLGQRLGGRVPYGQMITCLMSGPLGSMLLFGTGAALLDISFKFVNPAGIGDTLYEEIEVVEKKPSKKYEGGIVKFKLTCKNQKEEEIVNGTMTFLVLNKKLIPPYR